MTSVYPGLLDSSTLSELRERVEQIERWIAHVKTRELEQFAAQRAGETLLDALVIDSQGPTTGADGTPDPDATREPPLADRGESAPLRSSTFVCARCLTTSAPHQGCKCNQNAREPFFRPGDRCCVHTGGDPCVKPGTVEKREHDGRWLVALDRAGRIKAREDEMVFIPGEWK